jgi:hypothetical protein
MGNNCRAPARTRRSLLTNPLIRIDFIFEADSLAELLAQERRQIADGVAQPADLAYLASAISAAHGAWRLRHQRQ